MKLLSCVICLCLVAGMAFATAPSIGCVSYTETYTRVPDPDGESFNWNEAVLPSIGTSSSANPDCSITLTNEVSGEANASATFGIIEDILSAEYAVSIGFTFTASATYYFNWDAGIQYVAGVYFKNSRKSGVEYKKHSIDEYYL